MVEQQLPAGVYFLCLVQQHCQCKGCDATYTQCVQPTRLTDML